MKTMPYLLSVLAFIGFATGLAVAQKLSAKDEAKLDAADQVASQFVEQFKRTRDFGTVWRAFRSKDTRCAIRLTPALSTWTGLELKEKSFEQRLRDQGLDDAILDRLFIATWNLSSLSTGYHYSYAYSRNGSEPAGVPSWTSAWEHERLREWL